VNRVPLANSKAAQKSLPDKLFYKIGEVSRITRIEPYVLRYWETEFPTLKPRKNRSGQRVYIRKDLEQIILIKELLYEEKYTIEGVRKRLLSGEGTKREEKPLAPDTLQFIKDRLRGILDQIR
jgi:DNA-binding transcriptional MerR regulator